MSLKLFALAAFGVWAVIVFLRFVMFPVGRKDGQPGPHNNWRKNTSTSNTSGWNESGEGYNGSCGGGESGGGGD